jgi:phosphogluconate dehydratase
MVFESQEALQSAFKNGELEKDFIAVVRYQGPKANGMPELHGLMPPLGLLQDKGYKVAIVTDGRMSGASGKVPSAIHFSPEALDNGMLAKVETGDMVRFDAHKGEVMLLVDEETLKQREPGSPDLTYNTHGFGRELFSSVRQNVGMAEEGASLFDIPGKERA